MKALYLITNGLSLCLSGQTLRVERSGKKVCEAPLKDIARVVVYGSTELSPQARVALLDAGVPLHYLRRNFYLRARLAPPCPGQVSVRLSQYRSFADPRFCLDLAREMAAGEIDNMRAAVERTAGAQTAAQFLPETAALLAHCDSCAKILATKEAAARAYFRAFAQALPAPWRSVEPGETADRVHFLLNLGYKCLLGDIEEGLWKHHLDPYLGALHRTAPGEAALALDMADEFRRHVDLLAIEAFNRGVFDLADFCRQEGEIQLGAAGLQKFFSAYESRAQGNEGNGLRKTIDRQAELLRRHLTGELPYRAHRIEGAGREL